MKFLVVGLLFTFMSAPLCAQAQQVPTKVRVPDATAAVMIAEPALIKVYGKPKIDYERPLTAELKDGVWYVRGTLCCPDAKGTRACNTAERPVCIGGVASATIRQTDGKILEITHGK